MPDGFGGQANKEVPLCVDEFPCFRHPFVMGWLKAAFQELLIVSKQPTGWVFRSRFLAARTCQLHNRECTLVPKKSEENLKFEVCESFCRHAIERVALGNLSRILVLKRRNVIAGQRFPRVRQLKSSAHWRIEGCPTPRDKQFVRREPAARRASVLACARSLALWAVSPTLVTGPRAVPARSGLIARRR